MQDKRKEEFLADLQTLLNKHNAELEVGDDRRDYGMHSGTCTISFVHSIPYLEFNLPTYMGPEE